MGTILPGALHGPCSGGRRATKGIPVGRMQGCQDGKRGPVPPCWRAPSLRWACGSGPPTPTHTPASHGPRKLWTDSMASQKPGQGPLSFAASESLRRIPSCCGWLWPCSLRPQGERGPEVQGLRMGKILAGWGPSESTAGLPPQASICPLCQENDMRLLSFRSSKSLILHGRFSGELADRVGADEASHWTLDPGGSPPPPLSTPLPAQSWE